MQSASTLCYVVQSHLHCQQPHCRHHAVSCFPVQYHLLSLTILISIADGLYAAQRALDAVAAEGWAPGEVRDPGEVHELRGTDGCGRFLLTQTSDVSTPSGPGFFSNNTCFVLKPTFLFKQKPTFSNGSPYMDGLLQMKSKQSSSAARD